MTHNKNKREKKKNEQHKTIKVLIPFFIGIGIIAIGFAFVNSPKESSCDGCEKTQPLESKVETINAVNAYNLTQSSSDLQIVDVREQSEYENGHLAKARLIPLGTISNEMTNALDKSKPLLVYCRTGHRSAQAVEKLEQLGFRTIYDLEGGITAWQNAGNPVIK